MLACLKDLNVIFLVEVMWYGTIDGIDPGIRKEFSVISCDILNIRKIAGEPFPVLQVVLIAYSFYNRTGPSSIKWHQRAAALANSFPISPRPMIPKFFFSCACQQSFQGVYWYKQDIQ